MGIVSALLGSPVEKAEIRTSAELYRELTRSHVSVAGSSVNEDNALRVSAVYACVRVLAESVASLPLIVYRRLPGGGKERATDHPLYDLLHLSPNAWQTSFAFREMQQAAMCLSGDAIAIKSRVQRQVRELLPVFAEVKFNRGKITYEVSDEDGRKRTYPRSEIFHVHGISTNGFTGRSVIADAREQIGMALAAEEYGARLFSNGANPSGVIENETAKLSPEAVKSLMQSFRDAFTGSANAHKTVYLDAGMKYKPLSMTPEDAQFIESRKFQIAEIARIFRIPPHMIGDLERATNNNIEHQSLEFVIHTLRPWLVRWEQAINRDLIAETNHDGEEYFAEFLVEGLLRGDQKSRYDAYAVARQWGWMNVDEIRSLENLNPLPDKKGQIYLQPMNMAEPGSVPPEKRILDA